MCRRPRHVMPCRPSHAFIHPRRALHLVIPCHVCAFVVPRHASPVPCALVIAPLSWTHLARVPHACPCPPHSHVARALIHVPSSGPRHGPVSFAWPRRSPGQVCHPSHVSSVVLQLTHAVPTHPSIIWASRPLPMRSGRPHMSRLRHVLHPICCAFIQHRPRFGLGPSSGQQRPDYIQ